jgi:hypothetical protein
LNFNDLKEEKMNRESVIPEVPEPAHSKIVELDDYLRTIYRLIREKYQDLINQAFDRASREIGFVVATTVPITFGIGERGQIKGFAIPDSSPIKDTLLGRTLLESIQPMRDTQIHLPKPGEYTVYLIWPPALKLKLYWEWLEPAHWGRPWTEPAHFPQREIDRTRLAAAEQTTKLVWESHEPAHWFNPRIAMSPEDALHLSLLDEVYPELRLMDRVVAARRAAPQAVFPEVKEPAHFRQLVNVIPELPKEMLAELAQVLRRYGY